MLLKWLLNLLDLAQRLLLSDKWLLTIGSGQRLLLLERPRNTMLHQVANQTLSTLCDNLLVLCTQLLNQLVLFDRWEVHSQISGALVRLIISDWAAGDTTSIIIGATTLRVPWLLWLIFELCSGALDPRYVSLITLDAHLAKLFSALSGFLANFEGSLELDLGTAMRRLCNF